VNVSNATDALKPLTEKNENKYKNVV